MRFHARGEAKVAAEDNMPETALEEHLLLFWPAGAAPGASLVWDEITGGAAPRSWHISDFGAFGRVKTPTGYYRLTGAAAPLEPTLPVSSEFGFVQAAEDDLLVTSGTNKSFEVFTEGKEFRRDKPEAVGSKWTVVAHGSLHSSRPVRLLEPTGVVPRRFVDPLLPAGRWEMRLMVRSDEGDGLIGGLPPDAQHAGARYDQRLEIWAEGSPTSDEAHRLVHVGDDEVEPFYAAGADSDDVILVLLEGDEEPQTRTN